jgi:hypothetical protein
MVDTRRVKRKVEMEMLSRNRCPLSGVTGNKIRHQAPGFRSLGIRSLGSRLQKSRLQKPRLQKPRNLGWRV